MQHAGSTVAPAILESQTAGETREDTGKIAAAARCHLGDKVLLELADCVLLLGTPSKQLICIPRSVYFRIYALLYRKYTASLKLN